MSENTDMLNKHFTKELISISDMAIREFVTECTDKLCGDYFWTRPAAKNNAYHPNVSCGDGGLIRHVKYACWWGEEILRAMDTRNENQPIRDNAPTDNHDVVIAALILHDMMKEGDPELNKQGKRNITGCHGIDMATNILNKIIGKKPIKQWQSLIVYAVAGHMGIWTSDPKFIPFNLSDPLTRHVAILVHLADYNASRKCDAKMQQLTENFRN